MAVGIIRHRRGTTAKNNAFTGSEGQITVDTEYKTARVHDGFQLGGFPLAKEEVTESVVANSAAIVAMQQRLVSLEGSVDVAMNGLDIKECVRAGTTANLTASFVSNVLTNAGALVALAIDGVTLALGDRVFVGKQTTGSQNGFYTVTNIGSASVAWTLTRAIDSNASGLVVKGMYCFVTEGLVNGNRGFALITANPITLNTTSLVFTQVAATSQVVAGNGLTKTGNSVDVISVAPTRIVVNPDNIDLAVSGVIPATYGQVQVDTYGRVTSGSNPSVAGWAAPTGTANRQTFLTSNVTTAELAERLKALIDDLTAIGLLKS